MVGHHKAMRIGILTAGGDCPGLNAAIRAVGKTAIIEYKMSVIGICSGYLGLIEEDYMELTESNLSGILTQGGTILRTSREKPFKQGSDGERPKSEIIKENYIKLGLDCLICIGGNGTMKTASKLAKSGLNVIGMPKTIDNDVWGTDLCFGFDSAVAIATEAIDRIHTTANSHKRVMVVEVMGHNAGWLALYSGLAGGGDIILIPELPYEESVIQNFLLTRRDRGNPYSIVVVAEGIEIPKEKKSRGAYIAKRITELTGIEARETILGYTLRGGTPSPMDRILATRLGAYAVEMAVSENFGCMAAIRNGLLTSIPLDAVEGKLKVVPNDDKIIYQARRLGTCFGDQH